MNKRSAMLVAAGLVLTMIVGGVALAVGATGPATSAAAPRLSRAQRHPEPIVKTIKRTVTVHRKASPVAATVVTTSAGASTSPSTSHGYTGSTGSTGDTSYGDDGAEDSYPEPSEPSESPEHEHGGSDD